MQAYCYRADGTAFPAEVSVSQLRLSTPHLCFFIRDETLRRQSEEMLRTEHNALQNASDAIVVVDMNSQIEYANPATARIWEYPSTTDLVGLELDSLLLNEGDGKAILDSLAGELFAASGVAVAVRHDGEPFRVNVRAASNRDSDGNVVGAVLSFFDLTERDKVQSAERDASRFRETLNQIRELGNAFKSGMDEVSSLLKELTPADMSDDEQFQKRLLLAQDACSGMEAILGDIADSIDKSLNSEEKISQNESDGKLSQGNLFR
ncbi:MAG: PAS domain-containing protein [Lentisphaerae bacterium]|nr:PAS domain-containing protein [Lentisphaerota bacterium]